jgi:hypothetical protein
MIIAQQRKSSVEEAQPVKTSCDLMSLTTCGIKISPPTPPTRPTSKLLSEPRVAANRCVAKSKERELLELREQLHKIRDVLVPHGWYQILMSKGV